MITNEMVNTHVLQQRLAFRRWLEPQINWPAFVRVIGAAQEPTLYDEDQLRAQEQWLEHKFNQWRLERPADEWLYPDIEVYMDGIEEEWQP